MANIVDVFTGELLASSVIPSFAHRQVYLQTQAPIVGRVVRVHNYSEDVYGSSDPEAARAASMPPSYFMLTDGVGVQIVDDTPELIQYEHENQKITLSLFHTNEGLLPHRMMLSNDGPACTVHGPSLLHKIISSKYRGVVDMDDFENIEPCFESTTDYCVTYTFKVPRVILKR